MIRLPEVNKKNWKKVLREIDIVRYPSLPSYLTNIRQKLLSKTPLESIEDLMGCARLTKYFIDYEVQINSLYIDSIDYTKFSERPPLEHQKSGVEFLLKNNRCILGDDMGLGKSITTIYAALSMEDRNKILIVTLKSLKYNFAKEVKYLDNRVSIVDKKWEENKFTIVHYDSLSKYQKNIIDGDFSIIILDEAHKVRNHKTKRAKAITEIISKTKPTKIWLLTGTPIDNRPSDYYQLLKMIKHPVAKNWITYVTRYCEGFKDHWGRWQIGGASNLKELHDLTKDVFLRRLKKNMGIGLPEKTRRPIFHELANRKGYNQAIEDFRKEKYEKLIDEVDYIGDIDDVNVEEMTKLLIHRKFCALEKIKDGTLLEEIDNMLDENEDNKIIVFTNFRDVVDTVYEHYGNDVCRYVDGRILDPLKRLEIIDEFNENPNLKILVCNLKVGSTGLNIQSANKIIINDMDWVPSNMLQAEDRAWRIGQTRDVEVRYLIYDDTVESVLYKIIEKKMQIVSTVVEGKEEAYFEGSILESSKEDNKSLIKSLIDEILAQLN